MSQPINLEARRHKPHADVVYACEQLLEKARSGEVQLLIWCAVGPQSSEMHHAGDPHDSFHMIGCMERMKLDYWEKVRR